MLVLEKELEGDLFDVMTVVSSEISVSLVTPSEVEDDGSLIDGEVSRFNAVANSIKCFFVDVFTKGPIGFSYLQEDVLILHLLHVCDHRWLWKELESQSELRWQSL